MIEGVTYTAETGSLTLKDRSSSSRCQLLGRVPCLCY